MGTGPTNEPLRYRVGDLVLDKGSRRVTRRGETLNLGGLTFDFFVGLVESAPDVVTYDRIAELAWQGRPITNETITQRAKMLRDALSEDASQPRYFESVRGQGYRLVADVVPLPGNSAASPEGRRSIAIGITVLAVVLLATAGGIFMNGDTTPSVAVLPFADMTEHGDQSYFADGVAEELINELSGLSGLHVAGRTSSFAFRGEQDDLASIGEALGVNTILEGSVRKVEDELRISVQLVDVESGYNLWSATFDRRLEDIFAIQAEIASAVAGALGVKLGVGRVNEFRGAGTRNYAAYEAFLRHDFERATELDPEYAAAWASLGVKTVSAMWTRQPEDAPDIIARAYPLVRRALELDPESARAHGRFATMIYARREWQVSEASFAKALSLRRDRRNLVAYANMLMRAGRSRAALDLQKQADAVERMPRPPSRFRVILYLALRDFDAAREMAAQLDEKRRLESDVLIALNSGAPDDLRRALQAIPESEVVTSELYAPLLDVFDSPARSMELLARVLDDPRAVWPDKYHDIALLAARFGDPDLALEAFSREMPYTTIRFGALWYPVMSEARRLPRFRELVTEARLPEYWRNYGWTDFCKPAGHNDFECY